MTRKLVWWRSSSSHKDLRAKKVLTKVDVLARVAEIKRSHRRRNWRVNRDDDGVD